MRRLLVLPLLLPLLAACGSARGAPELTVFAAASLTEAFTELAPAFEAERGARVTFNFAGSAALARQVADGAPADVLVTADLATMSRVAAQVAAPQVVARNRLAIAVEPGNPHRIGRLADLARPGLVVVLCAPEVPCGALGTTALRAAGVAVRPSSLEDSVKGVLSRVALGEADAGIVYRTDLRGSVEGVDDDAFAGAALEAVYPAVTTVRAGAPALARAWVDFVLGPAGRRVLARHGFLLP